MEVVFIFISWSGKFRVVLLLLTGVMGLQLQNITTFIKFISLALLYKEYILPLMFYSLFCITPDLHNNAQCFFTGTVTNIPAGMVTDQFGMIGLLTFIRAAETDANLVALAPGVDLTSLGLNLNSLE